MCNPVFSYGDGLRIWDFLYYLQFYFNWIAKLSSTIWASICSDLNLPIWIGKRS